MATLLDDILGRLNALPQKERAQAVAQVVKATESMAWIPNPGPQTDAYFCRADILGYGGQGGGGKTDLILGLAFSSHRRSLIMRRKYVDLGALTERAIEINKGRDGYNGSSPPKLRTRDGRLIEFGAAANLGDEQSWQGQPHDLLCPDEAVQFLESQIRFLMGWVRSTDPKQRCRVVMTSNPPVNADGQWIIGMFRPWLDLTHPNPAKPGELRWFVTAPDGKDLEVEGPEPVTLDGKTLMPQSRTFIPAALRDNPYLANTGYQAQLDALPEPYRSAVRDGNFMAARQDAANQVIPTSWIIAAQSRWSEKPPAGVPMCAMGVDASGGGHDPMVISRRYDGWFAPLIKVEGKTIPRDRAGTHCAGIVLSHRRDHAKIVVDLGGGYGNGIFEHLKSSGADVTGYKGSSESRTRTRDRQMTFTNKRSDAIWKFREALDPDQDGGSPIALPPDQMLLADLSAPTWEPVSHRGGMAVKVETKESVCDRLGRSTDDGDAVVMAWSEGNRIANVAGGWDLGTSFAEHGLQGHLRPQVVMGHSEARRVGAR